MHHVLYPPRFLQTGGLHGSFPHLAQIGFPVSGALLSTGGSDPHFHFANPPVLGRAGGICKVSHMAPATEQMSESWSKS